MESIKHWIWAVIAAIMGLTAGMFIKTPIAQSENAGGDITKVSKFQKNTISPQLSAFQEKMLNDPDELNAQVTTFVVLNSRLSDFENLISLTDKVTEQRIELSEPANALKRLATMSQNARQSSHDALIALDQLMDKNNKGANAYEQTTQNAALGFLQIERKVSCGKDFVTAADEYLKKNGVNGNEDLALVRDLWQDFCLVDAAMNSDENEIKYWAGVDKSLETLGMSTAIRAMEGANEYFQNISATEVINLVIVMSNRFDELEAYCPTTISYSNVIGNTSFMEAMRFTDVSLNHLESISLFGTLKQIEAMKLGAQNELGVADRLNNGQSIDQLNKKLKLGLSDNQLSAISIAAESMNFSTAFSNSNNIVDAISNRLGGELGFANIIN